MGRLPAGAVASASGRLPIATGNGQWREVGGERGESLRKKEFIMSRKERGEEGEEGRAYVAEKGEHMSRGVYVVEEGGRV